MWGKRAKVRPNDTLFSRYIRTKANWECEYCHKDFSDRKQYLQVSHYWGSGRESTRFDEDNVVALCSYHHKLLGHGDGRDEYREFMIKKLGQAGYDSLEVKAHTYKKRDDFKVSLELKYMIEVSER